jgi:hypothetical protein
MYTKSWICYLKQKLIFQFSIFCVLVCCGLLVLLTRVVVAAVEEVAAEATAVLVVVPLVEPACARVCKVIALIDELVGEAVLAVVEPEANALLLLTTLIRALPPVLCSTEVNATSLLCVRLCHTEDVLSEGGELALESGTLLEALKSSVVLVLPLVVVLARNLLFTKGYILPEGVGRPQRDVLGSVGVELEGGLGDVADESRLVGNLGGHLGENHREKR